MPWEWRGMTINFVLGQAIIFGKSIFPYGARKHPEIGSQTIPHPCVSLPHAAGARWGIFSHIFTLVPSVFHGWESVFVLHSECEERFTIWGL